MEAERGGEVKEEWKAREGRRERKGRMEVDPTKFGRKSTPLVVVIDASSFPARFSVYPTAPISINFEHNCFKFSKSMGQ